VTKATKRDPDNWRYHYELGLLLGGAGLNPRPQLLEAHRLNPHKPALNELLATIPKTGQVNWDLDFATFKAGTI
jgi:hypothetical protein